jgi:magnesium transporter
MNLSKSLVYLSTGLNADGVVLEKMRNLEEVQRAPEIMALLDDAIIENRQAAEMCAIHRDILSGSMDTFAS